MEHTVIHKTNTTEGKKTHEILLSLSWNQEDVSRFFAGHGRSVVPTSSDFGRWRKLRHALAALKKEHEEHEAATQHSLPWWKCRECRDWWILMTNQSKSMQIYSFTELKELKASQSHRRFQKSQASSSVNQISLSRKRRPCFTMWTSLQRPSRSPRLSSWRDHRPQYIYTYI